MVRKYGKSNTHTVEIQYTHTSRERERERGGYRQRKLYPPPLLRPCLSPTEHHQTHNGEKEKKEK